eukprot:tig00000769_g4043.t1
MDFIRKNLNFVQKIREGVSRGGAVAPAEQPPAEAGLAPAPPALDEKPKRLRAVAVRAARGSLPPLEGPEGPLVLGLDGDSSAASSEEEPLELPSSGRPPRLRLLRPRPLAPSRRPSACSSARPRARGAAAALVAAGRGGRGGGAEPVLRRAAAPRRARHGHHMARLPRRRAGAPEALCPRGPRLAPALDYAQYEAFHLGLHRALTPPALASAWRLSEARALAAANWRSDAGRERHGMGRDAFERSLVIVARSVAEEMGRRGLAPAARLLAAEHGLPACPASLFLLALAARITTAGPASPPTTPSSPPAPGRPPRRRPPPLARRAAEVEFNACALSALAELLGPRPARPAPLPPRLSTPDREAPREALAEEAVEGAGGAALQKRALLNRLTGLLDRGARRPST